MRETIKQMISAGVFNQHQIFNTLYPTYNGHYAKLRDLISEVKNDDTNTKR